MDAPDSIRESPGNTNDSVDLETANLTATPAAAAPVSEFLPGELIASRFRIVRKLGQGGMGAVYEAFDTELSQQVAIKTLRPEVNASAKDHLRFIQEVQIARMVTHGNVCRINDVFQHSTGFTRVLCISMELLRGDVLSEYLEEKGRLSTREALPMIQQVTAGLGAAHRAGVVHRDFKSSNIMLVRDEENLRVVVTDFGLARAEHRKGTPSLTEEGELLFTPAYVAPEQLQSGDVTAAADIYSLGIVLYEMMTGKLPFRGSSNLETALLRLKTPPVPPRKLNPSLPRYWEAVILRCLSIKPGERFASAESVSFALAGSGRTLLARRQFGKYRYPLLASVLLTAAVWIGVWVNAHLRTVTISSKRSSISVMEPISMDSSLTEGPVVKQITQLLANDLEATGSIRVIPHYRVVQAGLDLGTAASHDELTPESLARIRSQIDSDYVVSGSYTAMSSKTGPVLRIDLKVYDAHTGELLNALSASGPAAAPLELQSDLSTQLRSRLGLKPIQQGEAEHLLATIPPDPAAQRLYSGALEKLHKYDAAGAVPLLMQVTQISPRFPLAHLDLAEAYAELGYDARARDQAEAARTLLDGFPAEKKVYVEARSHELAREWNPAMDLYKQLTRTYADNPEYWLRLALTETSAGQSSDALKTIVAAREVLRTQDPRFALAEAEVLNNTGQFPKVYDVAKRTVEAAAQVNATSIQAKALVMQCWAALNLGRPSEAKAECERGAKLSDSVGDNATQAKALNNTANALLKEGNVSGAEKLFSQAFQILEQIGDERNLGGARLNYGNALFQRNDYSGAEHQYLLSLAAAQKRQDKGDIALATSNIAGVFVALGRLSQAEKLYNSALGIARSIDAGDTQARCLNNLGVIQAMRGELDAAMSSYNEALAMRSKMGFEHGKAVVLSEIGDLLVSEDKLDEADLRYGQALTIQERLGEQDQVPLTKLLLARGKLLRNDYAGAVLQIKDSITSLDSLSDSSGAALGHSLGAMALAGLRRQAEAQREANQAVRLLSASDDEATRIEVLLNRAEVLVADTNVGEQTMQTVGAVLSEANKSGLVQAQLRARLMLAKATSARNRVAGTILLRNVGDEARAKGLLLIARQAGTSLAATQLSH